MSKKVEMPQATVENTETVENKKPTYEELEAASQELLKKAQQMAAELQKANAFAASINRLDILFRVMDNAKYYDTEFLNYVTSEIEKAVVIKAEEKEEK